MTIFIIIFTLGAQSVSISITLTITVITLTTAVIPLIRRLLGAQVSIIVLLCLDVSHFTPLTTPLRRLPAR